MLLLSFVKINPPLRKKNDLMILFCLEVLKIPPHPKKKKTQSTKKMPQNRKKVVTWKKSNQIIGIL